MVPRTIHHAWMETDVDSRWQAMCQTCGLKNEQGKAVTFSSISGMKTLVGAVIAAQFKETLSQMWGTEKVMSVLRGDVQRGRSSSRSSLLLDRHDFSIKPSANCTMWETRKVLQCRLHRIRADQLSDWDMATGTMSHIRSWSY